MSAGELHRPEEHYHGFKQSFVSFEGTFPFVAFLDPYVVISPPDIEFGEPLGSPEFVH